jgi:hypothetical protein
MDRMAKKKEELKPEIKEFGNSLGDMTSKDMIELKNMVNSGSVATAAPDGMNSDNFFRAVITEMMSPNNISLKTEYVNVNENFAGAKLEFLARYTGMVCLKDFVNILEIKRVSLGRKSRIELIKAFEKRDEEVQAQNRVNMLKQVLGV